MRGKKFIIIFIVSVFVCGGVLIFRLDKNKKDVVAQQEDNATRLVKAAKKSEKSGLPQMARALKKYFTDNDTYPTNLQALYPKYIRNKSFIEGLDWAYKSYGSSFLLSKTVTRDGKSRTASIDESLKMKQGSTAMLAKSQPVVARPFSAGKKPGGTGKKQTVRSVALPQRPTGTDDRPHTGKAAFKTTAGTLAEHIGKPERIVPVTSRDHQQPSGNKPPMVAEDSVPIDNSVLSLVGNRYLIWLDEKGHLGFSNVQYPTETDLRYVYIQGKWERYTN